MQQKNFTRNQVILLLNRAKRRFRVMVADDADDEVLLASYMRIRAMRKKLKKMALWSSEISLKTFNLNVFSEKECYREFRFRPKDIGKIVNLCGWWAGMTKRRGYIADPVTAVCIVL